MPDPILLANYRAAWDALAMIREAVEEMAPPGSVIASEQLGPDPMQEAEALVRGIWAIAGRCAVSAGSAEDSVTQPSVSNDIRPNASTS